jgi:thiaminase/transcriptional activator TenA
MTFSKDLLQRAEPIMTAILNHPFIQGIAAGELPTDVTHYYVEQDTHYLKEYVQITALAITQTHNPDDIEKLVHSVAFVNEESRAHRVLQDYDGYTLQNARRGPDNALYINHMYAAAYRGSYAETIAALTPCPWTYEVIGEHLIAQGANHDNNPFKRWIELYAPQTTGESVSAWRLAILDREVATMTDEQKEQVAQAFLYSMELEWRFWDAAWTQAQWQFDF